MSSLVSQFAISVSYPSNSIQGALCLFLVKDRLDAEALKYKERDFAMREESIAHVRMFPKVGTVAYVVHSVLADILPFEAF